jgi:general secretion pathway protein G
MSLVVAIVLTLMGIAVPSLQEAADRARVAQAINELTVLQAEIMATDPLPPTLALIGRGDFRDPWGRSYQYLVLVPGPGQSPPAGARKDRFLVPINSTFDLYSLGADGLTQAALTAKASRDDVIRAADGAFIGLATNF